MWSLVVILKVRIPLHHPAYSAYSKPPKMPIRTRHTLGRSSEPMPVTSPAKRGSPELVRPGRNLRRRMPTTRLESPTKSSNLEPPLPSPLKQAITAKRMEWLEANQTGRAEIADPIEEELAVLEQRALRLNASAFRQWKQRMYR